MAKLSDFLYSRRVKSQRDELQVALAELIDGADVGPFEKLVYKLRVKQQLLNVQRVAT
jgi:hypothetical protein